jgi:L-rhamnose-H+ transport protein
VTIVSENGSERIKSAAAASVGAGVVGVVFHWLGGLASGSFYVPFRAVKKWSWETYWLVGGVLQLDHRAVGARATMTNDLFGVLHETPWDTIFWVYFFGVLWGFGGLTFGLTMRYLGMSLGMAMVLGYCAAFGTLVPPIFTASSPSKCWARTRAW